MVCNHDGGNVGLSRRGFIQSGALTAVAVPAVAAGVMSPAVASESCPPVREMAFAPAPDMLATAIAAAQWVTSAEQKDADGIHWLAEPDHPEKSETVSPNNGVYSGNAGTLLFFIELFNATGENQYLTKVSLAADRLSATWRNLTEKSASVLAGLDFSLCAGVPGAAFALNEAAKVTRNSKHQAAAKDISDFIIRSADMSGKGLPWSPAAGVVGDSSTVLYLLYAAREFGDSRYRDMAARAGDMILKRSVKVPGAGLMWNGFPPSDLLPKNPNFPGFEAGTAGIAYTLARIFAETKDKKYLDAAKQGAAYVESIAVVKGDAALVPYQIPDQGIYYLGYCHGASGSARLFYELYQSTGDPTYKMWVERLAQGIMQSGVPANRTPGFWNTVNQCCGNAGLIDFFLSIWASWGDEKYREYAHHLAVNMISRGTNLDGKGMRWDMAWTRVLPAVVTAETGYSIGASGIGTALLHLHLAGQGRYSAVHLPDNPFPRTARKPDLSSVQSKGAFSSRSLSTDKG